MDHDGNQHSSAADGHARQRCDSDGTGQGDRHGHGRNADRPANAYAVPDLGTDSHAHTGTDLHAERHTDAHSHVNGHRHSASHTLANADASA